MTIGFSCALGSSHFRVCEAIGEDEQPVSVLDMPRRPHVVAEPLSPG